MPGGEQRARGRVRVRRGWSRSSPRPQAGGYSQAVHDCTHPGARGTARPAPARPQPNVYAQRPLFASIAALPCAPRFFHSFRISERSLASVFATIRWFSRISFR
ncbi:hypothetical protein M2164_002120 [Streptomyces sp. SAI-208]|nr:hypothetical protein [Streptomyces sp. SAI-208]